MGTHNVTKMSMRYKNVDNGKDDAIALDWTFQVVKNYNVPGAMAMFTSNVGRTKEVFENSSN